LWPYLALAALIAFFFVSIVVVGAVEKFRIHDYEPAPDTVLSETSPYFAAMNQAAQQMGFQYGGAFAQSRGSQMYQCRLALWLTPDQGTLVVVVGGKIARMNYRKTFVFSRLSEVKTLVTLDEFGTTDLSGIWDAETLLNADLAELVAKHELRLEAGGLIPIAFSPTDLQTQYEAMTRARVERMIERGLATYVDAGRNVWKFTFKGAMSNALHGYLKGLKGAQGQAARAKIKRPGS